MKNKIFIHIENGIIHSGYYVHYKIEDSGWYSCYIPSFDIYYSAPTKEDVDKRGDIMVFAFYDFWFKRMGWKSFILQIHKLGFKAINHNMIMENLLKHKTHSANFNAPSSLTIPEGYQNGQKGVEIKSVEQEFTV